MVSAAAAAFADAAVAMLSPDSETVEMVVPSSWACAEADSRRRATSKRAEKAECMHSEVRAIMSRLAFVASPGPRFCARTLVFTIDVGV